MRRGGANRHERLLCKTDALEVAQAEKCSAGACPPPWAEWGGETSLQSHNPCETAPAVL